MTITYSITVTRYVDGIVDDVIYIDGYGLISEAFSDISDMVDEKGWDDNTEQNDDE